MRILGALVVVAGALALSAPSARADSITLDFTSGSTTAGPAAQGSYTQDGFVLAPQSGDHFEVNYGGDGRLSWHDGASNTSPNVITLQLSDGSGDAFSVQSVDVTSLSTSVLNGGTADPGGIIFEDSNGNVITATSTGTWTLNFTNTTYVTMRTVNQVNTFPISIDNLVVNTDPSPVPEPGTALLLGLGVVGAAVQRRRRGSSRG